MYGLRAGEVEFNGPSRDPDGHFKFPHFWPVKFLQAGRLNYRFFGGREFGLLY